MSATNILGISAYYHDSAAALLRDGQILAAAQLFLSDSLRLSLVFFHGGLGLQKNFESHPPQGWLCGILRTTEPMRLGCRRLLALCLSELGSGPPFLLLSLDYLRPFTSVIDAP